MSNIHRWTIFGHFVFFILMSLYEFLSPRKASEGLIQPMKKYSKMPQQVIDQVDNNIAFKMIFFGLKKYHLLCAVSCFIIWFNSPSIEIQQYALLILGINFMFDDIWAATYYQYLQNIAILLPQFLFSTYDISLFFVSSPPKDTDNIAMAVCIPFAITISCIGAAVIYGICRKDLKDQGVRTSTFEEDDM